MKENAENTEIRGIIWVFSARFIRWSATYQHGAEEV
jgi:hypothetical protein